MVQIFEYAGRASALKGRMGGLPGWARFVLFVAAVPGVLLLVLSLLAVGVSILALLLLTVPVYRLLAAVLPAEAVGISVGPGTFVEPAAPGTWETSTVVDPEPPRPSPGRRQVDVKIIE